MNIEKPLTIGERIRTLRKKHGYSQTELANLLGKSLRTVQKYESGDIEVSISVINQLAKLLDTTSTYLIGQKPGDYRFQCLADVMDCLFQIEKISGLHFRVDVKKPPRDEGWQCSIVFDGKDRNAALNADMCLFLEDWEDSREEFAHYGSTKAAYKRWKDQTLAYYAPQGVEMVEPEDLDEVERTERRNAYLAGL